MPFYFSTVVETAPPLPPSSNSLPTNLSQGTPLSHLDGESKQDEGPASLEERDELPPLPSESRSLGGGSRRGRKSGSHEKKRPAKK